jgi:hypothetical protein
VRRTALLLGLVLLSACGSDPAPETAADCAELPPADSTVTLPEGFPAPEGQVLYEQASQGSTRIVFGRLPGDDVVAARDRVASALESAGYALEGTDQEAVEAEVHFRQPLDGTVRVTRLCVGQLQLRYRLSPP